MGLGARQCKRTGFVANVWLTPVKGVYEKHPHLVTTSWTQSRWICFQDEAGWFVFPRSWRNENHGLWLCTFHWVFLTYCFIACSMAGSTSQHFLSTWKSYHIGSWFLERKKIGLQLPAANRTILRCVCFFFVWFSGPNANSVQLHELHPCAGSRANVCAHAGAMK